MSIQDLQTKVNEFKQRVEEARNELKQKCHQVFTEVSSDLFTRFPALEKFHWTQYTPYWNDGGPCHFDVYDVHINGYDLYNIRAKAEGKSPEEIEKYRAAVTRLSQEKTDAIARDDLHAAAKASDQLKIFQNRLDEAAGVGKFSQLKAAADELEAFFKAVDSSDRDNHPFKLIFGDHCQITVTREGIEIGRYDHD